MRLKLKPHFVPRSLWGQSAANLLPRASWGCICTDVLAAAKYRCEVCKGSDRLNCHEVWLYDDKSGIATLIQFKTLCGQCHQVVHMGLTVKHGGGRAALIHLCKVNGIGPRESRAAYDAAMAEFKERSKKTWNIDVAKPLLKRYPQLIALIEVHLSQGCSVVLRK